MLYRSRSPLKPSNRILIDRLLERTVSSANFAHWLIFAHPENMLFLEMHLFFITKSNRKPIYFFLNIHVYSCLIRTVWKLLKILSNFMEPRCLGLVLKSAVKHYLTKGCVGCMNLADFTVPCWNSGKYIGTISIM